MQLTATAVRQVTVEAADATDAERLALAQVAADGLAGDVGEFYVADVEHSDTDPAEGQ